MWSRNTELKGVFDALSQELVGSVPALETIIKVCVGLSLNRRTLPIPDEYLPYFGNLRCKQYPNELAQLLAFLYTQRGRIRSYLEIGVERCGTFFTVDSYLRGVCPEFGHSIALDKRRHDCGFDAYQALYDCEFVEVRSGDWPMPDHVDLVLIDAPPGGAAGATATRAWARTSRRCAGTATTSCCTTS